MTLAIERQYLAVLRIILQLGERKDIFGADGDNSYILSHLGVAQRHSFADGFPIYSAKKVAWQKAVAEMLWFLKPRTDGKLDVRDLQAMGCRVWDDWAKDEPLLETHYRNFTSWQASGLDQTEWVLNELPKNPHRKSYLVSAWDPSTTYGMADASGKESVCLPACHFSHQLLSSGNGEVNMVVNIRSNDMPLGNCWNVVQYGALLEMYCHCMRNRNTDQWWRPGQLILLIADAHIYSSQIADVEALLAANDHERDFGTAHLHISQRGQTSLRDFVLNDFALSGYDPAGFRKMGKLHVAGGY